jgi:hypothetical protein
LTSSLRSAAECRIDDCLLSTASGGSRKLTPARSRLWSVTGAGDVLSVHAGSVSLAAAASLASLSASSLPRVPTCAFTHSIAVLPVRAFF